MLISRSMKTVHCWSKRQYSRRHYRIRLHNALTSVYYPAAGMLNKLIALSLLLRDTSSQRIHTNEADVSCANTPLGFTCIFLTVYNVNLNIQTVFLLDRRDGSFTYLAVARCQQSIKSIKMRTTDNFVMINSVPQVPGWALGM